MYHEAQGAESVDRLGLARFVSAEKRVSEHVPGERDSLLERND
jgi:hypothetical protein